MRRRFFIDDGSHTLYGPYTQDRAIRVARQMVGWRSVVELEGKCGDVEMFGVVRTWSERRAVA